MVAFVPVGGVNTISLQNGLRHICGTAPARTARNNTSKSTTTKMVIGDQGITLQRFLFEPNPGAISVEDKDIMCTRVWKQVFGNAYVMEEERAEVYKAESMYRAGQIPLREFVRAVALSETYRRRFFECCTPMRAVELNLKHLLGRGPVSKAEMSEHIARIANEGFEADINSYIDSEEYEKAFGDDYIPGPQFKGTYPTIEEFNRMCSINGSPGRTDKSLTTRANEIGIENSNRVLSLDGAGVASKFFMTTMMEGTSGFVGIKRGVPGRSNVDFGEFVAAPSISNEKSDPSRRVEIVPGSYMFLSASEEAAYKEQARATEKMLIDAERELQEVNALRAALESRVAALESAL